MASTFTVNTGIELIANGEQSGTWGDTTNLNLQIIDRLTNGVGEITITGTTHTLTTADGALSPGQFKVLVFVGTPSGTNTVTISPNDQAKQYFIVNNSGESIVLTQGSGTTVTVADGASDIVFADGGGTGANVASLAADLSGVGTVTSVSGAGTVNGITLTGTVTSSGNLTLGGTLADVDLTSQITGTLPVANGGTGITSLGTGVATWLGTPSSANLAAAITDETGSGELVFATSPTLVTPVLGTPSSGTLSNCTVDGTDSVGFRNIPQNSQSAVYTLVLADSGKHIFHPSADTTARTFTIPANSSVAFPVGTAITFINQNGAGVVTIAITTDTLRLADDGGTGSRALAANGVATCIKVTSTEWIISGVGLT